MGKGRFKLEDGPTPLVLKKERRVLFLHSPPAVFLSFSPRRFLKDSKCEESNPVWVNTTDRQLPTPTQFGLLSFFFPSQSAGSMFFCVCFRRLLVLSSVSTS